jgi:hypothetical protein
MVWYVEQCYSMCIRRLWQHKDPISQRRSLITIVSDNNHSTRPSPHKSSQEVFNDKSRRIVGTSQGFVEK